MPTPVPTAPTQEDMMQSGILKSLPELVTKHNDKSAQLLAVRALVAAAGHAHAPLREATTALPGAVQSLWGVLAAYAAAEPAITAALAAVSAKTAPTLRRTPGAREPADPDEWLPVSVQGLGLKNSIQ
jgi:hypothetical protein